MTQYPDMFANLARPFDRDEVKSRPGDRGRAMNYITARVAMNRFDEVMGPECWTARFYEVRGVLFCEITLTLPDGSKVSKTDAGGFKTMWEKTRTGEMIVDQENTDKTGPSDAFKRAAAMWGVGRYLYQDGSADFGVGDESHPAPPANHHDSIAASSDRNSGHYAPPPPSSGGGYSDSALPRSGKAVWGWMFGLEKKHEIPIRDRFNKFLKARNYPDHRTDPGWSEQHIADAIAEVQSIVGTFESQDDGGGDYQPVNGNGGNGNGHHAGPIDPTKVLGGGPEHGDPHKELKMRLTLLARKACVAMGTERPTPDDIASRLRQECEYTLKVPLPSLRHCKDVPLMRALADHMDTFVSQAELLKNV